MKRMLRSRYERQRSRLLTTPESPIFKLILNKSWLSGVDQPERSMCGIRKQVR